MSIYTLQNEQLLVCVNSFGCTLASIYDKISGREMLWQMNDKRSWQKQDVCIFPFVARLKDGFYEVDGKEYSMPIHGFCNSKDFVVTKHTSEYLEMCVKFDEYTLKMYPYKFEFVAKYQLFDNKLQVTFMVKNLDDKSIYYGIGGHPAFAVDGVTTDDGSDITGNKILLDGKQDFIKIAMDNSNVFVCGEEQLQISNGTLELSKELFANDAIILKNDFGKATLLRKNGGKMIFETDSTYLAFWSYAKFGEYVCFEPWWTLPDDTNPNRELKEKSSILCLGATESREHSYSITIEN